jgi:hypothetical protein
MPYSPDTVERLDGPDIPENIIVHDYNYVANRPMTLREAFYGLYIEPVILFAKLNVPAFE